jgi:hypothetical protein
MSIRTKIIVLLLLGWSSQGFSQQGLANSPLSQFGIGDILPPAFAAQAMMGGTGVSNSNGIYINNVNPALLVRNRNTVLDFGAVGRYQEAKDLSRSQRSFGANLQYIGLAFPIGKKWTSALTLAPYTAVNYQLAGNGTVGPDQVPVTYTYTGKGGINQASFATGFSLGKKFSLGIKAIYVFGGITEENSSQIVQGLIYKGRIVNNYTASILQRINYSDFTFKAGVNYRIEVKDRLYFNAGATYNPESMITARNLSRTSIRAGSAGSFLEEDTLSYQESGSVRLPATFQAGVSLDRPFQWALAFDATFYQGNRYRGFDGNPSLSNGYTLAAGGEWLPNINSVSSYFNRITYRTGLSFSQTPYVLNGNKVYDAQLTIGFSMPVSRSISDLNLGLAFGQRGYREQNNYQEQYIRFNLGVTINDRWFQRRRID